MRITFNISAAMMCKTAESEERTFHYHTTAASLTETQRKSTFREPGFSCTDKVVMIAWLISSAATNDLWIRLCNCYADQHSKEGKEELTIWLSSAWNKNLETVMEKMNIKTICITCDFAMGYSRKYPPPPPPYGRHRIGYPKISGFPGSTAEVYAGFQTLLIQNLEKFQSFARLLMNFLEFRSKWPNEIYYYTLLPDCMFICKMLQSDWLDYGMWTIYTFLYRQSRPFIWFSFKVKT